MVTTTSSSSRNVNRAADSSLAFCAPTMRPPVLSAMQLVMRSSSSSSPRPTTYTVTAVSLSLSALACAHGSAPQVSRPSVTRMIALVTVSDAAGKSAPARSSESPMGVHPTGV